MTTYILELSEGKPQRYRISVLRTSAEELQFVIDRDGTDGFKTACITEDRQQLHKLLARYIALEISS